MNPFIFRKYDIRGIVGQDLSYQDAVDIGAAFGTYLIRGKCSDCFVGRDNRLSSEKISQSLISGLLSTGVNVVDTGLSTTPMIYWSRNYFGLGKWGSVEVTGSHNPPEYNGFKPCFKDITTITWNDIQHLRRLIETKDFEVGNGHMDTRTIYSEYFADIKSILLKEKTKPIRRIRVVVDSGNAVGGIFAPNFYRDLGFEVVDLHSRLDGTFPNHMPDPAMGVNIRELVDKVRENKADIGIAFDGDVDRLNIVDETGYVVWGDGIIAFLARQLLKDNPGLAIIFNTQCSPGLAEDILNHGGKPICVPVGHSLVAENMERFKTRLAGEYKGHIYFSEDYEMDDAIYTGARILQILAATKVSLSSLLSDMPVYKATGEIIIPATDEKKFVVIKHVAEILKEKYLVTDLDGDLQIRFGEKLPDTSGLVRMSGTMPEIQVYAWSKTDENLTKARDIMVDEVSKYL